MVLAFYARSNGSPQSPQITLTSLIARIIVPQQGQTYLILQLMDFLLPSLELLSLYWQAAGVDTGLAQGFLDLSRCLWGQLCYRPVVFLVLLNYQTVGLGGGLKLHIVIIAVIAYVLNIIFEIVEVGHFM